MQEPIRIFVSGPTVHFMATFIVWHPLHHCKISGLLVCMSSLGWRHIAELMLQCSCGREAGRQLVCPSMSIFSVRSLSQLTMQQEIRADIVVCNVWVLKEL